MALLAEYALTPGVFDVTAYTSEEVCGLHLQALKDVLLHEGLVRNLRSGEWAKTFDDSSRSWHQRGKELLKSEFSVSERDKKKSDSVCQRTIESRGGVW